MSGKKRVALWNQPQRSTTVEEGATVGATVGVDLRWPDGSVVTRADLTPAAPVASPSSGAAIQFQDEGSNLGGADATTVDFTGAGVTATRDGAKVTVNVPGGGGGGGGAIEYVGEVVVEGSAATNITVSDLDLDAAVTYLVLCNLKNATGSTLTVRLFYNGDTTAGNYPRVVLTGALSTATANRVSDAVLTGIPANAAAMIEITITRDLDGIPRALSSANRSAPASLELQIAAHTWTGAANVTSLTISSSVANGFAVGSKVRIWKRG